MADHVYTDQFYQYINEGSIRSARYMVPAILSKLQINISSMLDVGCGAGAWVKVWQENEVEAWGLDNDYVSRDSLLIDKDRFIPRDLVDSFRLEQQFDLVQSLEVAEHLPNQAAEPFVQSLCAHADIVVFSAAPPGQGGEYHINEQPYQYWRELFDKQDFQIYDIVRKQFRDYSDIEPCYRYNLFVFVRRSAHPEVHNALKEYAVAEDQMPMDISPPLFRLRKWVLSLLPVGFSTFLAVLKKNLVNLRRGIFRR